MQSPIFTNAQVSASRIIYTPSAFARSALLHLQEVGTLTAISPHTSSRSGLDSYLFFIVRSGSGMLNYEGKEYELTEGDCVFISCESLYAHRSSENLWTLNWVHFYGPNLRQIYRKYRQRGGRPVFSSKNVEEYRTLQNKIYEKATSDSYVRDMEISECLGHLLTLLMEETVREEYGNKEMPKRDEAANINRDTGKSTAEMNMGITERNKVDVSAVKEYIDSHFTEAISLENLAERFYISRAYLARMFKVQYGVTVTNYVNQQRVTKAKELLRFSDETIEAIAVDCGFEPNYFTRIFKKLEGMPPSEYRARW